MPLHFSKLRNLFSKMSSVIILQLRHTLFSTLFSNLTSWEMQIIIIMEWNNYHIYPVMVHHVVSPLQYDVDIFMINVFCLSVFILFIFTFSLIPELIRLTFLLKQLCKIISTEWICVCQWAWSDVTQECVHVNRNRYDFVKHEFIFISESKNQYAM